MRRQVDGAVEVVASPVCGFSATQLSHALGLWPAVKHLTLLGMSDERDLQPLATMPVAGLRSLTIREAPHDAADGAPPHPPWPMMTPSSAVAATLQVIDVSGCSHLTSIDAVRSCVQLRCLWMPSVGLSDLSPLTACSNTLEELWLAGNEQVESLVSLKACPRRLQQVNWE
ncbi:hypothetical protein FOA52_009036 [Chlamydomonas sp. UWO 241]|nr:hypothetical protein FOA52_009036 [Chlamydomonas sp. UWO 241]